MKLDQVRTASRFRIGLRLCLVVAGAVLTTQGSWGTAAPPRGSGSPPGIQVVLSVPYGTYRRPHDVPMQVRVRNVGKIPLRVYRAYDNGFRPSLQAVGDEAVWLVPWVVSSPNMQVEWYEALSSGKDLSFDFRLGDWHLRNNILMENWYLSEDVRGPCTLRLRFSHAHPVCWAEERFQADPRGWLKELDEWGLRRVRLWRGEALSNPVKLVFTKEGIQVPAGEGARPLPTPL